jgi:phosphocarrier protein
MSETLRGEAEIRNAKGLHARAAAKFCKTVERFDAVVRVARNGTEVTGTSIMGLMMLAAGKGATVEISVTGAQAKDAFEAVMKLIADKFDEE